MSLPPNKPRSRRLRKKMHIGEFKELGFDYKIRLKENIAQEDEERLVNRFFTEVIESRNLALGGWLTGGFISAWGRGSATEQDRVVVEEWLRSNLSIETMEIGPLKDAWYEE